MRRRVSLAVLLLLLLPVIAMGEDFSYARYEAVLAGHVRTGVTINGITLNAVDYAALSQDAKRSDSDYAVLLKDLASFDPEVLGSREEKMAFWVNVYNIGAIKTVVDHYPVESIRSKRIDVFGQPWSRKAIVVGGKAYSLAEIEHTMLLDGFHDLRIHFGINCASVSCVDLLPRPYRAQTLFAQLEEQGRAFLADPKRGLSIERDTKALLLSQIFQFDRKRFDTLGGGALAFIQPYVASADKDLLESAGFRVEYLGYDWSANDVKFAR